MLPLSGGADSSATAAIVGNMCQLVTKAVADGNKVVEADARRYGPTLFRLYWHADFSLSACTTDCPVATVVTVWVICKCLVLACYLLHRSTT